MFVLTICACKPDVRDSYAHRRETDASLAVFSSFRTQNSMTNSKRISRLCLLALTVMAGTVVADQKVSNHYFPADKLPWYRESPAMPVDLAPLWGTRAEGEAGTLLRTPAGFESGLHSHTADYWAVVVQGTWKHWVPTTGEGVGLLLEPGAHWTQIHTQLHQDACVSKVPCVIFLFNKDPYLTNFPKPAK